MAKDTWADVQLLTASECKAPRTNGYLAGRGVAYFSAEDHLTFRGYWPWSDTDFSKLIVFDAEGMIKEVLPCPHSLPSTQIAELRRVAQEALTQAETDGESRMLTRIRERLEATDGTKLASSPGGCTDLPVDRRARPERKDVWRSS